MVSKTARVTEEIDLRKDVEHATETVRKQEVEVEDERGSLRATGTGTVATPNLADTNR